MKNMMKGIAALAIALSLGTVNVDADTATRKIDVSACETVYTNYYFFLDANTTGLFNTSNLSGIKHSTIAEYHNNSYQVSNFNASNIGYGQVNVTTTTTTSRDGITSMSLDDYYTLMKRSTTTNGAFSEGTKSYIVSHDWYAVHNDESVEYKTGGLNLGDRSISELKAATLNANSTLTRLTNVTSSNQNPFKIRIDRNYYGYLTGTPIHHGNYDWYLHPAVYYIQYCSPARNNMREEYTIRYDGNGSNVYNVPSTQYGYDGECLRISNITPTREGYRFLGWSTRYDVTTADSNFAQGRQYCGTSGNIVLYAVWERIQTPTPTPVETYTVYYRSNTSDSVANMPNDTTVDKKNDIYISGSIPVRNGYTFLGWNTDANSPVANTAYNGGILYTDRKDITLYAIWKKNDSTPVLPDNPQTGIEDYLLPFGGAISISGAVLGLLKRKKSFRQF